MTSKEETKIKILAELVTGAIPKELAKRYGVGYQTILEWRKKQDDELKATKDITVLVESDLPMIKAVAERIKETAPAAVADKLDKLTDGIEGLKLLDKKFHTVVLNLLAAAEEMSKKKDLTVKDWSMLSAGIGSLYSSVFNKAGVSVNVMNQTNVSSEKLSMFKHNQRDV